MRKVIFDVETSNFFEDVGSNDPTALDLSVVCIYDSANDSYHSFLQTELKNLWPILEKTDLLIGFNSDHFDIPLLNKYYSGNLAKIPSLDLLKEIKKVLGRRLKLDSVAEATLGRKKIGHGFQAVEWWRKGEMEKLKNYCLEDVRLTKELYDYALANKHLKYKDLGKITEIPLDSSGWEQLPAAALTHTLPF